MKGTPYRWLDVVELAKQVVQSHLVIEKVRYFTARVSGAADPGAPRRQHAYLRALATRSEVEIHYGKFLAKTVWRPLKNLPVAGATIQSRPPVVLPAGVHDVTGSRTQKLPVGNYGQRASRRTGPNQPSPDALIVEVHTMEEKGSDVNLAAHLLNDAWLGSFDAAVVISNDTDLVEPIRMVAAQRQKPVWVVCPGRSRMSPQLRNVATRTRHIQRAMLAASQFPDPVVTANGQAISKPNGW